MLEFNPITGDFEMGSSCMKSVTYAELVNLCDFGKLTPGMKYRITDYQTTVVESGVKSDANVILVADETRFDVIVTAISNKELSENAEACCKEGKTPKSRYKSWKLKYTTNPRGFAWVGDNHTGVIYYMKDEFDNVCPYDFKTIKFLYEDGTSLYTFSVYTHGDIIDSTALYLPGVNYSIVRGNVIEECNIGGVSYIPLNSFLDDTGNSTGSFMSYNKIGAGSYDNTIMAACSYNVFLGNTIGKLLRYSSCRNIIFPNCSKFILSGNDQIFNAE